ncbi:DnaJ C-terminal domain-containing protein [Pirellulaceae bacterium SH467]|jgi:DnaJ-class molecular chaperone
MAEDYYKVLGVEKTASAEEITKAYRKLARKHHPDLNPDDAGAKKRFQEIQTAYDCLNDSDKRAKYDQFGAGYEQLGGQPFGGDGTQGFDFGDIFGGGGSPVDFSSIFGQFGGGRSRRQPRGADVSAEIFVPIRTLVQGGETQIQLNTNGTAESITVKIPAGIEPGKKIRLRGRGQSVHGGKPGDLLLTVHAETNPHYKLSGRNLELRLPISLAEAIQGGRIDVQTPSGTISLTIPPMSSSGKKLRLKGQGFKGSDGIAGDMLVELMIKLPDNMPDGMSQILPELQLGYTKPVRQGVQF